MTDPSGPTDGGPAFACAAEKGHQAGMSRRAWLAGMAMQGMLAAMKSTGGLSEERMTADIAAVAYIQADAMIACEREEK